MPNLRDKFWSSMPLRANSSQNELTPSPLGQKSVGELLNAWFVYKVGSWRWLVENAPSILVAAERLHLSAPIYYFMKKTFFKHYCAGESPAEIVPFMKRLQQYHIGCILDLSIEADEGSPENPAIHDKNMEAFRECVNLAQAESFVAVKLTALGSTLGLQRLSSALDILEKAFTAADSNHDGKLTSGDFASMIQVLKAKIPATVFTLLDRNGDGLVDLADIYANLCLLNDQPSSRQCCLSVSTLLGAHLNESVVRDNLKIVHRMERLSIEAIRCKVQLMVDAEQTYFQSAIDLISRELSRKFNVDSIQGHPIIFTTVQMYRIGSFDLLKTEFAAAELSGYVLGVKLVRGAYITAERKRADQLHYSSPIRASKKETDYAYDEAAAWLIERVVEDKTNLGRARVDVVVATHNSDSVERGADRLRTHRNLALEKSVRFGQLLGMADYTTFSLAREGFQVFKYTPCGPVREVVPYMLRRAIENSDIMGSTHCDQQYVIEELKRRLFRRS